MMRLVVMMLVLLMVLVQPHSSHFDSVSTAIRTPSAFTRLHRLRKRTLPAYLFSNRSGPHRFDCPEPYEGTASQKLEFRPSRACTHPSGLCLIPQPFQIERPEGSDAETIFLLSATTVLDITDLSVGVVEGRYLQRKLRCGLGLVLELVDQPQRLRDQGTNIISLIRNASLGLDSYRLDVRTQHVSIAFGNSGGLFYAFTTLRQLISPLAFSSNLASEPTRSQTQWAVPLCSVLDRPRFRILIFS